MALCGREQEQEQLQKALDSGKAEFVALFGRRRVGKTFLIRQYVQPRADFHFEVTGQKDAPTSVQLHHFKHSMQATFKRSFPMPRSWDEAFAGLVEAVEGAPCSNRVVLFFDELPWLARHKSGVLQALDYWWNSRLSRLPNLKLIVCGSAAAWIIEKLVHARGGLHNRITRQIVLQPFTVFETRAFMQSRGSKMNMGQLVMLYMAVGGVPFYLEQVEPRHSATQAIQALCFDADGVLRTEFPRLFSSLFDEGPAYEQIVRTIAKRRKGMLRPQLIEALGLSSGGGLAKKLRELENAGFVAPVVPYDHKRRNVAYRVVDPYVFFYLRWIEDAPKGIFSEATASYWLEISQTPAWRSWAGFAFETLCMQHSGAIKAALGLSGIAAQVGSWHYQPNRGSTRERGAQVDLLFDRSDGVVTLCELKHKDTKFAVDKDYARNLANKIEVFQAVTRTRKQIQLALVTTHGLRRNLWSEDLIDQDVDLNDLFGE
ncbi:MAG: ATP-binding protein [Proteobacteria bacterium]|nr:ATP-binding protein [Pseudomonadota bacterium]